METKIINNNLQIVEADIINSIKTVFDPEIDYSVYDIGLIYEVNIQEKDIKVVMTLTSINCPEAQTLPDMVKKAIENICPHMKVDIEITFEPEWTIDNMSDEIKLKLGLL